MMSLSTDETLEGVFLISLKYKTIVYVNDKCETLFGYEQGELINRPFSFLNVPLDHLYNAHEKFFEAELVRKDLSKFWGRIHTVKFDHADYGLVWLCVLEDITKKRDKGEKGRQLLLQNAIDKVKSEIAGNLHDDVGQLLTVLKMDLHQIKSGAENNTELFNELLTMDQTLDELIKRVRTISFELMPTRLLTFGLIEAIQTLINDLNSKNEKKINLSLSALSELDHARASHFFRIIQEALTNSIRHSSSNTINVDIEERNEQVMLYVQDFDNRAFIDLSLIDRSIGLSGMRERALLLGGKFSLHCDGGVHIKVEFPVKEQS